MRRSQSGSRSVRRTCVAEEVSLYSREVNRGRHGNAPNVEDDERL